MIIREAKDYNNMSRIGANIVSAQVILKKDSVLGLATGNTPIGVYKQLIKWNAKKDVDFSSVKTFNLDEYIGLSKENKNSYYSFMWSVFFKHINIERDNVYIPDGMAENISDECLSYESKIKQFGGIDLQVLGIGRNGHIGFNEPSDCFKRDTHAIDLTPSTVEANLSFFENAAKMPKSAITMGMGSIMRAKKILLLCSGKEKADVLNQAILGDIDPLIPASILQLHSDVTVVADAAALQIYKGNSK